MSCDIYSSATSSKGSEVNDAQITL
jgi:hypothetical protein